MKYSGEKCFSCGEVFKDNDDVVVCPECGTPYHRHCYKEQGSCINDLLHENGEVWQSSKKAENKINEEKTGAKTEYTKKICPKCSALNESDAKNCSQCGESFEDNINGDVNGATKIFDINKPFLGLDPDEEFDGAKVSDIFTFVKTNTLYYIPIFKKMQMLGSKLSLNLTSFLFPYFYFANRKMWFMAIISVIVTLVLKVPSLLINFGDSISYGLLDQEMIEYAQSVFHNMLGFVEDNYNMLQSLAKFCAIGGYIFRILMCFFGNWFYYKFVVKSVKKIKMRYNDDSRSQSVLSSAGGTNILNIIWITLVMFAGYIGLSFIITFVSFMM